MITWKTRYAQRGQAVVETVFFLPLFLLALFGMIWVVQSSVQFERVETALRYASSLSQRTSPYTDYSFNAMYRQIDLTTQALPSVACTAPLTALLADGAPYTSSQTVTASPSFWSPSGATQSCVFTGYLSYQPGTGDDVILGVQEPKITAPVPVPSTLKSTIGTTSSASLSEFFYKQIGVDVVLACFPAFESMETASLNPAAVSSNPLAYSNVYLNDTPQFPLYASYITTLQGTTENKEYFPLTGC